MKKYKPRRPSHSRKMPISQLILGQKRVSFLDLEMDRFNSELEAVEENSVSLTGRQASFRGTGCTIGSVSIFE
jgi:hypothetical protein